MKINRKLKSGLKAHAQKNSASHSGISMVQKFGTLEVIFLTMLPIDAAVWYVAHSHSKLPVTAPAQIVKTVSVPEVALPVFKPELPLIVEPVLSPLVSKAIPKQMPLAQAPIAKPVERAIAKIEEPKPVDDSWSEDLVKWNNEANAKVAESMIKYEMEKVREGNGRPRRLGSMTYGWQDSGSYHSNNRMVVMANDSDRAPSSVGPVSAFGSHRACTLKPAMTPDPLCRAKSCCRVCGGTCCMCEAKLEGLLG